MNDIYRLLSIFALLIILTLSLAVPVQAFDGQTGEDIVIKSDEVVYDDLYIIANDFTLNGTVTCDLVVFGAIITINGTVEGGLIAGGQRVVINGIEYKVLVTGDACNTLYQFESGIGPGYFSSDLEQAQDVLDRIIVFKELYPEVKLVFGHDLQSH